MIRIRTSLALIIGLAAAAPAAAQTYTWTGASGNGNWNDSNNWMPVGVPTSSTSTLIHLAGTTQTTTTQNITSPFILNQLIEDSSAANGFTVNGGALQFTGSGAGITYNGPSSDGMGLRINTPVYFSGPNTVTIAHRSGATYDVVLAGPLASVSGTGSSLTVNTGTGVTGGQVALLGSNATLTGGFTVGGSSVVSLGGANATGGQTNAVTFGTGSGTLIAGVTASTNQGISTTTGVSQAFGNLSGAGTLQIGYSGSAATVLSGFNNAATTSLAGPILAADAGSQFAKVGTGALTYTGSNTSYAGGLTVRGGTVSIQGAGQLSGSTSSATSFGGTTIYAGGTLDLNNTNTAVTDRLQNSGGVSLAGGRLTLEGNSTTAINEQVGVLTVVSGQSTIAVTTGGSQLTQLQFTINPNGNASVPAILVPNGATVFFPGTALGGTSVGPVVTFGPVTGSGGVVGSQTRAILPWALGSIGNGGTPDTFVTIGAFGVRPLTASEYAIFNSGTSAQNVRDGSSFTTLSSPMPSDENTRNSLVLTGGSSQVVTLGGAFTLTTGALLNTVSGTTVAGAAAAPLLFGSGGSGTAYITTTGDLTLAAPAQAAFLGKSGAGTLTVQRPFALGANGVVAVNAGTLAVQSDGTATTGRFSTSSGTLTYQVSQGATLDVAGVTLAGGFALGPGQTLRGNGTVAGPVTIGSQGSASAGGTIAPSALAGPTTSTPATSLASPGTLTVGNMVWGTGGAYQWYIASATGGTYTQSLINSSGTLALTATTANPFTIKLTSLTPTNAAGGVYDFDPTKFYTWTVATFSGGVTYTQGSVVVDASAFTFAVPPPAQASFSVVLVNNSTGLAVQYTPTPEPAGVLAAAAAGLAGVAAVRRRVARRPAAVAAG